MARRFSHLDRQQQVSDLQNTLYDVVVVGGGITGAGIAADAALRGLKTALLEKDDWGAGTSSKSSKLVHGGLRYLEQLEFGLVMESTAERAFLMKRVSHLVRPLPFTYPVYNTHKHSPWFIQMGMWLYDCLALFRNHRNHKRLSPKQVAEQEPLLKQSGLRAAMYYYDCITDDARLTLENAMAAHNLGATVLSRMEVKSLASQEDGTSVIAVWDPWEEQEIQVRARRVVNAAGPWTNQVLKAQQRERTEVVRPTKGVHVVVPRETLPVNSAVVVNSPRDGRIAFIIPWEESIAIGTTDTDYTGSLDDVRTTREDVEYLLEAIRTGFPEVSCSEDAIISTWAGLRPLIQDDSDNPYNTSREHEIIEDRDGVITIAGGKLTTYRKMAEECVDKVIGSLGKLAQVSNISTRKLTLPGAENFQFRKDGEQTIEHIVDTTGIPKVAAERLVTRYGSRWKRILEGSDNHELLDSRGRVLKAEVNYAIEHEMVGGIEDFMLRRTHLFYHLNDQGVDAGEWVVEQLQKAFAWSSKRTEQERDRYRELVSANRSWKEEK